MKISPAGSWTWLDFNFTYLEPCTYSLAFSFLIFTSDQEEARSQASRSFTVLLGRMNLYKCRQFVFDSIRNYNYKVVPYKLLLVATYQLACQRASQVACLHFESIISRFVVSIDTDTTSTRRQQQAPNTTYRYLIQLLDTCYLLPATCYLLPGNYCTDTEWTIHSPINNQSAADNNSQIQKFQQRVSNNSEHSVKTTHSVLRVK